VQTWLLYCPPTSEQNRFRFWRKISARYTSNPSGKDHIRRGFCCPVKNIQNYCHNNIHKQHELYQVRAYVACDGDSLDAIGFYYLCLTSFEIGELDDRSDDKFGRVKAVPAVYLGMIAVHDEYTKSGVGKMLMAHALHTTAEIADRAGTYALTLDALDERLVEYYKKFDFQTFKQSKTGLEMFLPLGSIQAAIAASEASS
jgi:GNAT superfamily N-acetyltransferase